VKTAERIIEYRQQNGSFFYKEDLMKIRGIGKKKFEALRDSIAVE
ncbi:helix-hairpin-helix domain-containing protein, partial [Omnitrophica bacterium]|nr:helix-hairpin-helix domain-containing protein [Candidatus Omnitrophota bacterium]